MGRVMRFSCNDCGYKKDVMSGTGMLDFNLEEQKELFNCPGCGCISLRTVKCQFDEKKDAYVPLLEKRQKCRKCSTIMIWAESGEQLTCPQCHSNHCEYSCVGFWD